MTHDQLPARLRGQTSIFVVLLGTMMVLLLAGLVLVGRSLRTATEARVLLDAGSSARIISQEVDLVAEQLSKMGTNSAPGLTDEYLSRLPGSGQRAAGPVRAVWLVDTLGAAVLDSVIWTTHVNDVVQQDAVRQLARTVARTRDRTLQHLSTSGTPTATSNGLALFGEPVVEHGKFVKVAIALLDEATLLMPAGGAAMKDRAFLALLADGDTAAEAVLDSSTSEGAITVRSPLPGYPPWFVVSALTSRQWMLRWTIWVVAITTITLLTIYLIRERQQARRVAERSVELERLSAELLHADRLKGEFLAGVSHELRTPLNAIVGFIDLLRDGGYGDLTERQRVPVERVSMSAARLRTLVDQVLDMAKVTAGRVDVRVEPVVVRPFIESVLNELEPLLMETGLAVDVQVVPEIIRMRTDPTYLRQIMINLLSNAIKSMTTGCITLRVRLDWSGPPPRSLAVTGQHMVARSTSAEEWVAIEVVDTGVGIAEGDLERIFEEFEQIPSGEGTRGAHQGTGLGLPISRRLAGLLGGDISVESTPGEGSVFTVWLPRTDEGGRSPGSGNGAER
ncbi:MAG TPA: HAMP domain-containing sensor histidine kinase [Gemmatimonadaceae bacterium]|nr:HAMP domain-containing sensor histidine kinase [Gemmatimonadaceae bacterium]